MRWVAGVALAVTLAFLVLPLVALLTDQPPAALVAALGREGALDALWLSARVTAVALALVVLVGTPAAWLLATRRFRGRAAVLTLVELPLVLPPAVAGVALLAALGPRGLVGEPLGLRIPLTGVAVVLALAFVSGPYYVRQAVAAFEAVDRTWLDASRTLGAGEARTFLRVAVPVAAPGLLAGGALALGRALGEFGATLVFAGSFAGVTRTAPLAVYELLAVDLDGALALSCVLVAASAAVLLVVKLGARDPRGEALR